MVHSFDPNFLLRAEYNATLRWLSPRYPSLLPIPNLLNDWDYSQPKLLALSYVLTYLPIPPAFAAVAWIRLLFSHTRIGKNGVRNIVWVLKFWVPDGFEPRLCHQSLPRAH